jgi:hypothetical protein
MYYPMIVLAEYKICGNGRFSVAVFRVAGDAARFTA